MQLVAEAGALFGSRHYRDYHFLVTLSDDVAHFGLEHHESSDDRSYERSLIDGSLLLEFSRAASARIHALLERKIPAAGGTGDAGLPAADEGRSAVGVRRADGVSGEHGAHGAEWIADRGADRARTWRIWRRRTRNARDATGVRCRTRRMRLLFCTTRGDRGRTGGAGRIFTRKGNCYGWMWTTRCAD